MSIHLEGEELFNIYLMINKFYIHVLYILIKKPYMNIHQYLMNKFSCLFFFYKIDPSVCVK